MDRPDFVHAPTECKSMTVTHIKHLRRAPTNHRPDPKATSIKRTVGIAIAALAGAALLNRYLAKKAERDNPPTGKFLEVMGARLHYVERGAGDTVVLLHGNGSMIQDFEASGLIDQIAENNRVIVFDRPGFGHSTRPRSVLWTLENQAELLRDALAQLGVFSAVVLGH
jgi:hypothetical protein